MWLHSWEKTYKDALDIDLPDVQGNRPVKDFVRSLQDVNPSFHTHHLRRAKEYLSLREVINKFCTHLREDPTSRMAGHGAFSALFQDQTIGPAGPQSEKQAEKLNVLPTSCMSSTKRTGRKLECLCGKLHHFPDCPYLIELKRGRNWVADKDISCTICEKMERSKRLTQIVEGVHNGRKSAQPS